MKSWLDASCPTIDSLDELVKLIVNKASDLAVLAGLNRAIENHEDDMEAAKREIKRSEQ